MSKDNKIYAIMGIKNTLNVYESRSKLLGIFDDCKKATETLYKLNDNKELNNSLYYIKHCNINEISDFK